VAIFLADDELPAPARQNDLQPERSSEKALSAGWLETASPSRFVSHIRPGVRNAGDAGHSFL